MRGVWQVEAGRDGPKRLTSVAHCVAEHVAAEPVAVVLPDDPEAELVAFGRELRSEGLSYRQLEEAGFFLVVAGIEIKYF